MANVAESIQYINDKESVSILSQLLKNQDSSVSHQAKESLDYYRSHRVDRVKPTKASVVGWVPQRA